MDWNFFGHAWENHVRETVQQDQHERAGAEEDPWHHSKGLTWKQICEGEIQQTSPTMIDMWRCLAYYSHSRI